MNDERANAEFRCPGEEYSISHAVHLGRLTGYYAACRACPHRDDTRGLSARQVRRLADMPLYADRQVHFGPEGIRDAAINDLSPGLARRIAIEFVRRAALNASGTRRVPDSLPIVAFAGDGRMKTAAVVAAVVEGIRWTGCEVVDLGAASAPCLMRAVDHVAAAGGIHIGNPGGANHTLGMRFWLRGKPVPPPVPPLPPGEGRGEGGLQASVRHGDPCAPHAIDVYDARHERDANDWPEHDIALNRPTRTFGPLRRVDATDVYLDDFRPAYHALRPLRFVLQCTCGPVFTYLEDLLRNVACRVIPVEPSRRDFGPQIVAANAHFGMQITHDGEHCRVFDEQGRELAADRLERVFEPSRNDALRTLTCLLVLLSRGDAPLSAVLDRTAVER